MVSILIKNGTILTAEGEFKGDVLIKGEKIAAIGMGLDNQADEIVDADGKYIMPGGVDEHVHYASFSSYGYETTHAAVAGGTTVIGDYAPQDKDVSLVESIKLHKKNVTDGVAMCDYVLHATLMDPKDSVYEELADLPSVGVASCKMYMAYKGMPYYVTDDAVFKSLQIASKAGVTIMVHCENADIIDILTKQLVEAGATEPYSLTKARPRLCEAEATSRAIYLAKMADSPIFVVHVTCKEAIDVIRDANQAGFPAYGETCTHYLVFTEEKLALPNFEGAKYVCMPPLRLQSDVDALWEALRKKWLQAVGSDHCAVQGGFAIAKRRGINDFSKIPPGAPGVQNRMGILWTYGVEAGKISRQQFVDIACTSPAKICGIYPQKGTIAVGSDADIVVWDPKKKTIIKHEDMYHGNDYCAYEGYEQIGFPEKVYLRGTLTAENGKFLGKKGQGKQIMAKPYGLCYQGIK